ncbi:hypothetical protein [Halopseudomonas bauzanensis]|uniref:Uncharacterized protein n=1 Tax=Halopseudomonas bauzanensis TaxID=653930 RepID=A0A1I4KIE8_9GAMM|nr:hypothetical protein [Halopseudomonas bauzanensis]SER39696.1 hypothetical protein SAMN05216589_0433 [Halopseudomonas bauzanensis]SFL78197.1 hypothetical protein SAMN04487855_1191 [Halopseudomonas bauzanensis]
MSPVAVLRIIAFYLLAVLVATILGCLVQAQIQLAGMPPTEVPVSLTDRLASVWPDLLDFVKAFALLVAVAFVCLLPVAAGLARIFRPWRWLLFALAGAGGVWAGFKLSQLSLPGFIATPEQSWGLAALLVAAAIGSWLFGQLTRPKARRGLRVLG